MSGFVTVVHPAPFHMSNVLSHVSELLGRALTDRQNRRQLAQMDDRMLADIGASRTDAAWEASQPIWKMGALDVSSYR